MKRRGLGFARVGPVRTLLLVERNQERSDKVRTHAIKSCEQARSDKVRTHAIKSHRQQGGFTLLEVLVAFVVFVLVFGAVLEAMGLALRNTRRSAEVSEAALWAQSKLDSLGTVDELEEGSDSGEFSKRYQWQLDVSKYEVARTDGLAADSFPVELYRVDLTVSWGERNRRNEQHFITLRSKLKEGQF